MRKQTVAFATRNNSFFKLAMMIALIMTASVFASAQTTTFAQFLQRNATNDFIFTNNGSNGQLSQVAGGVPVYFFYSNINNLDPSLSGLQSAHVFVTSTTTAAATTAGSTITQPFNNQVTVQIIRDTPAPAGVGTGTRTNLLTAVFSTSASNPSMSGSGGSATFQGSTPSHIVTFTSDFLGFALTTQRNGSLSFSSVSNYSVGPGGFLDSFTAAATGTFASNPPPIYNIPSAAPVSIDGQLVSPTGTAVRRGQVVLTEADGTVHVTNTNNFGFFRFEGISSGQNVTFSSNSKKAYFSPVLVPVGDNIVNMLLTTEQ